MLLYWELDNHFVIGDWYLQLVIKQSDVIVFAVKNCIIEISI